MRVLCCAGTASTSGVIAGLNRVTSDHAPGPAVANLSLGGSPSSALDTAVRNSIADGITYAVGARNNSTVACTSERSSRRAPRGRTSVARRRSAIVVRADLDRPAARLSTPWDSAGRWVSGNSLTVSFKAAGLGNAEGATFNLTGTVQVYSRCYNRGGNKPQADKQAGDDRHQSDRDVPRPQRPDDGQPHGDADGVDPDVPG